MISKIFYTNVLGLFVFVLFAFVISVESGNEIQSSNKAIEEENHENGLVSENENDVMHWPWPNRKFKCPTAFGAYPDPTSCANFYICVAKIATRTRCPYLYRFCKVKRVCLPMLIAVCDEGSGEATDDVTSQEVTTKGDLQFVCPEENGQFLHHEDCKKYYDCEADQSTLKTCPDHLLFDGVKRRCRSPEKVHCGSRERPTGETSLPQTTQEIVPDLTTPLETESTTDHPDTPTPTEATTTEPPTTTTEPPATTTEPPVVITTTPRPRVTAPDTDCDEDDLDCIIEDLGETPDWFVCETDMGSYPHPTSRKLFIFCLNWKPSVKKCGQDLVFSEELMTCVSPDSDHDDDEDDDD